MADALEPPAKRARFDEPDGDIPGSPVDDMDDDFYDTTPVKPPPLSGKHEDLSPSSANGVAASSGLSSLQLPGLGLLSNPLKQDGTTEQTNVENEDLEDGELSDEGDLYNDAEPVAAPVAGQQPHGSDTAPDAQSLAQVPNGAMQDNDVKPQSEPPADPIEQNDVTAEAEATNDVKPELDEAKAQFLQAAEANKGNAQAEWELDSQQSESSSDSSSNNSDDSSEEGEADSDEEGELLDPEEQVRRLMMEAVDEAGAAASGAVRTQNEVAEQFEKPDITITDDTVITELGKVEAVVDNLVIIKANTSGDYQVLESGSALCLENRTVIGKVVEEIGRVQEPRYSVGFSDPSEIQTLGIAKDTKIFYVNEHSTFVFTEPLKAQKFTDASNLYDEEANDVEFSDDEKEAEFKKKQKEAKKAKAEANREPNFEPPTGPKYSTRNDAPPPPQPAQYQGGGLNYGSDDDEDLGMYKPLARPDHFEDIVGAGAPLEDRSHVRRGAMRGRGGGWPDRGRNFRSRGGGGNDRGCFNCGEVGHKKSECPHRQDGGRGNQQNQRGRSGGAAPGGSDRGGRQARSPDRGGRHGGPSDRGGIPTGPSAERDGRQGGQPEKLSRRQEKNRQRNNRQKENRANASMSPNRQRNERPPQHSPPGGGRGNSQGRKRNRYESPPGPSSQAPTSTGANAYAQNNAYNSNSSNNTWPAPASSATSQPAQSYAPPPQPAIPAGSYVNPAFYGQQQQAAPAAPPPPPQAQQQQNLAQWAQWFQLAAAMSQPQAQAQAPTHNQHPYQQQQQQQQQQPPPPQQHTQPPPDPRLYNAQQGNAPSAQHSTQSLQDILRTLGGQQNR